LNSDFFGAKKNRGLLKFQARPNSGKLRLPSGPEAKITTGIFFSRNHVPGFFCSGRKIGAKVKTEIKLIASPIAAS